MKKPASITMQNELTGGYPAVAWRNIVRRFYSFDDSRCLQTVHVGLGVVDVC